MKTYEQLVRSSRGGELGSLFVEKFGGKLGRLLSRKDAEFLMECAQLPPSAEKIKDTVCKHYRKNGYLIENVKKHTDAVEVLVRAKNSTLEFYHINITTNYPITLGGKTNYVRVTTTLV